MIDIYNNIIVIILVIIITVLFSKLIYSHKEQFADPKPTFNFNDYFGKLPTTPIGNRFNLRGGVIDRLIKDPIILKNIRSQLKTHYYDAIIPQIIDNENDFGRSIGIKETIDEIPNKFNNIINKYRDMNNIYNLKKKQIESIMLKDVTGQDTINDFNVNNLKLKKKLKRLTDTVVSTANQARNDGYILLKNRGTDKELSLTKNNNLKEINKYRIFTEHSSDEEIKYYYVNINNRCLESLHTNKLTVDKCNSQNKSQLFMLFEVKNNETYNKMIKLSGNYKSQDLIDVLETSVNYPFFIICPFNIPGYCIYQLSDTVSIKPVRNDPYQQFDEIYTSTFCNLANPNKISV